MNLVWAAGGAVAGLAAGGVLRGAVFRLAVPGGEPHRTACPNCGERANGWLTLRCRACHHSLGGPPLVLELATAIVVGLLAGVYAGRADLAAMAVFGALGVALTAIDIDVQRLPDRLTLPAYPVLIAALGAAAIAGGGAVPLLRALLAGVVLTAAYLLLALVRPGQLGGGDIKLAGLAGLVLGWLSWLAVLYGALLAFVLSALVSLGLLAARRVTLSSAVAFGPFLIGGALIALLVFQ